MNEEPCLCKDCGGTECADCELPKCVTITFADLVRCAGPAGVTLAGDINQAFTLPLIFADLVVGPSGPSQVRIFANVFCGVISASYAADGAYFDSLYIECIFGQSYKSGTSCLNGPSGVAVNAYLVSGASVCPEDEAEICSNNPAPSISKLFLEIFEGNALFQCCMLPGDIAKIHNNHLRPSVSFPDFDNCDQEPQTWETDDDDPFIDFPWGGTIDDPCGGWYCSLGDCLGRWSEYHAGTASVRLNYDSDESSADCPAEVDCECPDDNPKIRLRYRRARSCVDGSIADLWMLQADADAIRSFKYGGVCYFFGFGLYCADAATTIITPDDVTEYESCAECSACEDDCVECDTCTFCPDPEKTRLEFHLELIPSECGLCEGSECGQCCNCDGACHGCGHAGGADCICFVLTTSAACIAAGHQWYCFASPFCPDDTISPCSNVQYNGDVSLVYDSHSGSEITFIGTIVAGASTIVMTFVLDCVAKTLHRTILVNGRCRMEDTIGFDCDGTDDNTEIPMTDDTLGTTCTSLTSASSTGGALISGIDFIREGC